MTDEERTKCHAIIHSCAIGSGASNLIPIPGTGIAGDMLAMTAMTVSLARVFGSNITDEIAKGMAILAIKETLRKSCFKVIIRELSKIIPFAGPAISATLSTSMIEAAGWDIAEDLSKKAREEIKN